jgi:hypothetical protein
LAICAVGLLATVETFAGFAGTDVYIASAGEGDGVGGSRWRTTVWIHNPGGGPADCEIHLLFRNQANPSPPVYRLTVPAGDTVRFDDAFTNLFGIEGYGALRVVSDLELVVNSRIFNQPGADPGETQGQFFSAVPASFAIGLGESTDVLGVNQASDNAFRFNYGFVEVTGTPATLEVELVSGDGIGLGSRSYALQGREAAQFNLSHLGAGSNPTDNGRLHVTVTGGTGRVIVFGSGIANVSQDPSTFEMTLEQASASGDGDITAVNAGVGLEGGGTSGDVTLSIAAGGVTQSLIANEAVNGPKIANGVVSSVKLSAAGSSPGQLLTSDGSTVTWEDPPAGGGDGDITAVNAGNGLTGGGTSGDVTLALDTAVVQSEAIAALAPTVNNLDSRIDALEDRSVITVVNSEPVSPDNWDCVVVNCPPTHPIAIGGGIHPQNVRTMRVTASGPRIDGSHIHLYDDGEYQAPDGWQACAYNLDTVEKVIKAAAICTQEY